jgi:DNA polymerase-3 subunit epsilon
MASSLGILSLPVAQTPVSIVDIETTGLTPGYDRIIEISVARLEPGRAPEIVFDTLVDPRRPVAATFIHGITDDDVADAPTFREVAGDFVRAVSGSVVAAYNVYFDIRFIEHELAAAGMRSPLPHFCLMYMRPMLSIGDRCPLDRACAAHRVPHSRAHSAAGDCLASARLFQQYLDAMRAAGISTFADLARLRRYKFTRSWQHSPLSPDSAASLPSCPSLKSRWRP